MSTVQRTVRTMIELTEEQARAFAGGWPSAPYDYRYAYDQAAATIAAALREVLPQSLNVGARVCYTVGGAKGDVYELCAIDGTAAWLKHHDGRHSTALLADLVRAS